MVRRPLLVVLSVLLVLVGAACSGDDPAAAPSGTLATSSSTSDADATTTTRALTVEQEVEAAYLRSWDVYAEAVRTFDVSRLAEVYTGRALEIVVAEVARLNEANTPIVVKVEHSIDVDLRGDVATVIDHYVNRNYRIDGDSGDPIDDPNDPGTYVESYTLKKVGETWRVDTIERQSYSPE